MRLSKRATLIGGIDMILYDLNKLKKLLRSSNLNILEENLQNIKENIVNRYLIDIFVHLAKIRYTESVLYP
jgi:predicted nucleotidyltransferase